MMQVSHNTAIAFLKEHGSTARRYIGASVFLSCLNGALMVYGALLLARVVAGAATIEDISPYLSGLIVIYALRAVCVFAAEHTAFRGAETVKDTLRRDILSGLTQRGKIWGVQEKSGAILNAYIDGVEALQGYYTSTLPSRMTAIIIPLAIFIIVFPLDFISGLVLLVTAPLIPVFMIWIGRGAERLNQRQWRRMSYMSGRFLDVIQGLTTLKLFNASRREAAVIARLGDEFRRDTMAVLRIAFLSSLAMEFFATVSIALIAVLIGFRLLWGEMVLVDGLFILLLAPEFYLPLRRMGAHYHAKMEAIGAVEKIIPLTGNATGHSAGNPGHDFCAETVSVEFRNVSFSYGRGVNVLDGVSFHIAAGERIALAGPSGGGKSTVIALILGLIRPQHGQILVNGHDLSTVDMGQWRKHLSWMNQRPRLFPGTVFENVRWSHPGAMPQDVDAVLQSCGILHLSDKTIGEGGCALSGGQVQRVAAARTLLRGSPLLLLDEPTAHLDQFSEAVVHSALDHAANGATILFAAHRPAALAAADRILWLENGNVREQSLGRGRE